MLAQGETSAIKKVYFTVFKSYFKQGAPLQKSDY